jgi:hypothetical protein
MEFFDQACDEKEGILIYLPVDSISENLWSHPRYPALLQKMRLRE